MGRMATHWKINAKVEELTLFRSRIVTFQTAMNMNLQMIQVCLFVQAQEENEATQNDVLDGVAQLRREIKQLTKISQGQQSNETEPMPDTVWRCLNIAVALDESASTVMDDSHSDILSMASQTPSERVQRWMQYTSNSFSNANGCKVSSNDSSSHTSYGGSSQQSRHTVNAPSQMIKAMESSEMEEDFVKVLQMSQDLLSRGQFEPAKSLCRKVIHETEAIGTNHPSHKQAIETLAHIYEYTGDHEEASQLRLLLDPVGRNTIRNNFKALMHSRDLKICVNHVFEWGFLLKSNAPLQTYRAWLDGLQMERGFSSSILFAAVCIMGNALFAQLLLSQGCLIHSQVFCSQSKDKQMTPLGCAIRLGHPYLVQTLLEVASNDMDAIIDTKCIDLAIEGCNVEVLRILLSHLCLLRRGLQTGHVVSNRFQSTVFERIEMGAMLAKKSKITSGPCDPWKSLLNALYKAINQKDLTMMNLLLSYGIRSPDTLQLITRMNWLEGVQAAATQANHVSEEDITYAFQSRNLDICNYLLSLNPKCATSVTNDAMEGAGIEGLQMVIKFGANVNHPVYWSSAKRMGPLYPLHFAVHIGSSEMVKALLAAGADVRNQDEVGQTALQFAIKKGQRKDLPEKGVSATMGIVALLKGVEPRKTNSGATTSSYSKGSSLRSWWSSSRRHQVAATVGN